MSDLLLDLIDHLKDTGIVEGDGIDSYRDFTPEEPDSVIAIHEYAGDPVPLQVSFTHRSLQINVRDKSASKAKEKCTEIFNELSPLNRHKVLSNGRWCQLYPRQTPFKLKIDEFGRVTYCFNIGVTAERD